MTLKNGLICAQRFLKLFCHNNKAPFVTFKPITVSHLWRNATWMLFLVSCDSFKPETPYQVEFATEKYYTLPGSSIVIDLKSVIKQSFVDVSLTVSENPLRGTLTEIDNFLLKYTPGPDFTEGTDQFVLSAVVDNSVIETQAMEIFMEEKTSDFGCGLYAVEDFVRLYGRNGTSVHPLINDYICDVSGPLELFIQIGPKSGEAIISGDSIIYTSGVSFGESDELVYGISTAGGEGLYYGIVSFNKGRIETLPAPLGLTDIFFVNDTLGFASGDYRIFKTIDGGRHWLQMTIPRDDLEFLNIDNVFFLDEDNGYATFHECIYDFYFTICTGGWMITKDGGMNWKRVDVDYVPSIFFLSPSTGFLSNFDNVWKTIDAGETWQRVFASELSFGASEIRFANDKIGYAFNNNEIFNTTDGGNTWLKSPDKVNFVSIDVTNENVLCANIISGRLQAASAIVRSEGGVSWTTVIDFLYSILAMDLSPSGNLGVAVGQPSTLPVNDPALTITRSIDKGKSWQNLPVELNGHARAISVPSDNVAYILCSGKIFKYYP